LLSALPLPAQNTSPEPLGDITGMYSFLHEGEFVQITLDQVPTAEIKKVPVTGFISRLGSNESDKDQVLDLWVKTGTLDGDHISFTTKPIHGLWYEFDGRVRRGDAKSKEKEGYVVIDGTLIEHNIDRRGKTNAQKRQISMRSFPNLDEQEEIQGAQPKNQ
jgi:hypothetical protein